MTTSRSSQLGVHRRVEQLAECRGWKEELTVEKELSGARNRHPPPAQRRDILSRIDHEGNAAGLQRRLDAAGRGGRGPNLGEIEELRERDQRIIADAIGLDRPRRDAAETKLDDGGIGNRVLRGSGSEERQDRDRNHGDQGSTTATESRTAWNGTDHLGRKVGAPGRELEP